jgi:hypothetical protein
MKTPSIALAASIACGGAIAAIAPGSSGNGELFLNVVDAVAKVSYTLDLGIAMDDFFIAAQQDVGYQRFWTVVSANFTSFLGLVSLSSTRWSVVALDSTGSLNIGLQRLYSTVRQGDEGLVKDTTNKGMSDAISTSQAGNFFSTINSLGTHVPQADYTVNGDSFSRETDSGRAYYGESGGLTPTLNGNASFNATNTLGNSSWFYYLTRSSTSQLASAKVVIDEFDNLGFDGYWGLVKVEDQDSSSPFYDPTSPYAGKYLLSFTMPVFDVRTTASFQAFALSIGRTEFSGGLKVIGLDGAAAAAVTERSAGWVTPLGAVSAVTAVPEPGQWALLLAGGMTLAWRARARRPQA